MAVLLLAMIPLWKLTHTADAVMSAAPAQAKLTVHVALTFAYPVKNFQLLYLGKVIMEGQNPANPVENDVELEFPKAGVDLQIKAECVDPAASNAIRIIVTPGQQDPIEKTAWGKNGTVDDVLTFKEQN